MKFSALTSVYIREKPEFLQQALDSVARQTLLPNELVIVLDGPITEEQRLVISGHHAHAKYEVRLVPIPENVGLGMALQRGLEECRYDYIVRLDTDDISREDRFEKQFALLKEQPDIDVLGSSMYEFIGTVDNLFSRKTVPSGGYELEKYAKLRNPVNHPTVVFKKASVLKAGGYQSCLGFEDYFLWVRLLQSGAKLVNMEEALVYFRVSGEYFARRGGWNYVVNEVKFLNRLMEISFLSPVEYLKALAFRLPPRLLPISLRKLFYAKLLREKDNKIFENRKGLY